MTRGDFFRLLAAAGSFFAIAGRSAAGTAAGLARGDQATLETLHPRLVAAVRARHVVTFNYKGLTRVAEPHAYGENAAGERLLLAFQTAGESASEPPPGWRTFVVLEIDALATNGATFAAARPSYRRGQPGWTRVHAEL